MKYRNEHRRGQRFRDLPGVHCRFASGVREDELERVQEQLRSPLSGRCVRWAKREQFHLTLKFLGNVESRRLEALTASIRGVCAGLGVLQLRAGRIGFFPDARRPRVIWTSVLDGRGYLLPCSARWKRPQPSLPVKRPHQSLPAM